jgi:hypothetical protein
MVDVRALQDAYNDAVVQGKKELARELLALWRDTLPERVAKHSPSTSRRRRSRSEGSAVWDVGSRHGEGLGRPI